MNKKYKIIALFGKSSSGKSCIQKWMVNNLPGMKMIVKYTTRPKRMGEYDDYEYHFVDIPSFTERLMNYELIEASHFNGWFYGTSIKELDKDKINVGVFDIDGINCLLTNEELDILPIYIHCPDKERLLRSLKREVSPDCKEVCRRFLADEEDFAYIPFEYASYLNLDMGDDICNIYRIPVVEAFIKDAKDKIN